MNTRESQDFETLLTEHLPGLAGGTIQQIVRFRERVCEENERQNLTRLLSPKDFFGGHVLDVWELLRSGFLVFPALDLGSGAGVPGLLAAVCGTGPWILTESEGRKAEFLRAAAAEMGRNRVRVFAQRAEEVLKAEAVGSVVARAVGTVEKIYSWLRPCSTWNNLVLLKGPKWDEEWRSFRKTGRGRELEVAAKHEYEAGGAKKRLIIQLRRVPRGTKKG